MTISVVTTIQDGKVVIRTRHLLERNQFFGPKSGF